MNGASRTPVKPMLALVGGAAAIGFAPLFVRWSEVGLNATAFWRLALALPVLWLVTRRSSRPVVPVANRAVLALAGFFFAMDLCFWHVSIAWTSVANSTLLANLTPVVVVVFYWVAFGRRPSGLFVVGALLAVGGAAGLALGTGPGGGVASGEPPGAPAGVPPGVEGLVDPGGARRLLGDVFGVLTSFWYAGYLLAVERARRTASGWQVTFVSTAVAMVITGAVALAFGEAFWPESGRGWLVLAALALLSHVLGQGGIVWALGQLPASLSAVVILVQPLVAAGLGWWWLGEALGAADAVFAALIIAGILVCRRATESESPDRAGA